MSQHICIGRDVRLVFDRVDGVEVEGLVKLRPGHSVLVRQDVGGSGTSPERLALVWTWRAVRMGSAGPTFRGFCRWQ